MFLTFLYYWFVYGLVGAGLFMYEAQYRFGIKVLTKPLTPASVIHSLIGCLLLAFAMPISYMALFSIFLSDMKYGRGNWEDQIDIPSKDDEDDQEN